jgi:hypothetical protein
MEYILSQLTDTDDFIITITAGEYMGTAVKITDLKYNADGFDFEIELPKNKSHLFEDEKFKDEISMTVGDIVRKSIENIWTTQEKMIDMEESVRELLDTKMVVYDKEKLLLEQFMEKGYLLKTEELDDCIKYIAINVKDNKKYDLNVASDFEVIRREVFTNIILN